MSAASLESDLAISVEGLHMSYGHHEVLHGLDLSVRRGEIFAVLGPNGAGKTTTIEILEGFRRRNSGTVRVLGVDPERATAAWRERVGVVLQSSTPEPELSVHETLSLYAGYYARPVPIPRLLDLCGLTEQAAVRNRRLSGGQQRRLDVALALVGNPDLLFLDEPTTGFDPAARHAAWEMVAGLKELGTTIVLTTHYLEEAEFLADRIAVIDQGRIVSEGTPQDLGDRHLAPTEISFRTARPELSWPLPAEAASGGRLRIATYRPTQDLCTLTTWALSEGIELIDLDVRRPSLEETYLQLTKGSVRS
jgi:ABC-2 type transport system ATP-binding protein